MTWRKWLNQAQKRLYRKGVASAQLDAELILRHGLNISVERLLIDQDNAHLSPVQIRTLETLLQRREARQPLAYIRGEIEFYGLLFDIDQRALIPRPESEALVTAAIRLAPLNGRLLDVGTGCANLAIAIYKNRPDLSILASDSDPAALSLAAANQRRHQAKIDLLRSDLFTQVSGIFDVIVANLPYVDDQQAGSLQPELAYEPARALFAKHHGLALLQLFLKALPAHLSNDGSAIIEHQPQQFNALRLLARNNGLVLSRYDRYHSLARLRAIRSARSSSPGSPSTQKARLRSPVES